MTNPIQNIRHDEVDKSYRDRKLAELSDVSLFRSVIDVIERPKRQTSSFSLHIPMETMARFRLLSHISGAPERDGARKQAVAMASVYEMLSDEVPAPPLPDQLGEPEPHLQRLLAAIEAGDVEGADEYAGCLARVATTEQFMGPFAEATLCHLGAAAHAPIFVGLAHRVGPALPTSTLLAGVARGLAEESSHRIRLAPTPRLSTPGEHDLGSVHTAFHRGLLRAPLVLPPESGGIRALVQRTMARDSPESTFADAMEKTLGSGESVSFGRWYAAMGGLVSAAARLMIDEVEEDAKYYWSHCLTIPQGIWAIGPSLVDRTRALRVASELALGFRSTRGRNEVDGELALPRTHGSLSDALMASPRDAAAVAFHTSPSSIPQLREQLALEASHRSDAHLVKYVLACLDCAAMDPQRAALYHAAAAYLTSLWVREIPADQLPEHLHDHRRPGT